MHETLTKNFVLRTYNFLLVITQSTVDTILRLRGTLLICPEQGSATLTTLVIVNLT